MIFKPESASVTAAEPGVAVLVNDAAGGFPLDLGRDCSRGSLRTGRIRLRETAGQTIPGEQTGYTARQASLARVGRELLW